MSELKVKDLPEDEKQELLDKMKEAGLKGILTEYQVSTAREKCMVELTEGNELSNKEQEEIEQPPFENKENKNEIKPVKKEVKICHICRGEVIDGLCSKCGFSLE